MRASAGIVQRSRVSGLTAPASVTCPGGAGANASEAMAAASALHIRDA
jgi:hypothetical protein